MTDINLYELLEVNKKATKEEIRNHYKKLAAKFHPDKESGNEKKFVQISNAYEILSDPDKRKIYDKYGMEGINNQKYESPQHEGEKKKCKNLVQFLFVDLEDIYKGSKINFEYTRQILCKGCDGTGTDNPAARRKCCFCNGAGETIVMQRTGFMVIQNAVDCKDCEGTGWESNEFICEDCNGDKISFEKKTIVVSLEKGSPDGYRYTFIGEGDQKINTKDGDLIVELVVKKHRLFRREGADLWYGLNISLLEAITGITKIIPTLDDIERIEISTKLGEVIQSGDVKAIIGKGMPFFNRPNKFGNLFIEFNVVFPEKIDEKKLALVEEILKNRNHDKLDDEKENNNVDKECYTISDFKPENVNTSVTGGKYDKEQTSKLHLLLILINYTSIYLYLLFITIRILLSRG